MKKIVKIRKMPQDELLTELVEYMVYYKMSYPTGQKDECTIMLNDSSNQIITPDTIYDLSDEVYVQLYLLSNAAIANIYKTIKYAKEI